MKDSYNKSFSFADNAAWGRVHAFYCNGRQVATVVDGLSEIKEDVAVLFRTDGVLIGKFPTKKEALAYLREQGKEDDFDYQVWGLKLKTAA